MIEIFAYFCFYLEMFYICNKQKPRLESYLQSMSNPFFPKNRFLHRPLFWTIHDILKVQKNILIIKKIVIRIISQDEPSDTF